MHLAVNSKLSMIYTGHPLYRLLAALCVLLVLLFAWQLRAGWDWGTLFFLAVALWSALRCARLMLGRVEMLADRLRLHLPGSSPHEVEFRQFSAVYEEGRGLKSILLLYHPRTATGLFDLDVEHSLVLPAVNEQAELLAALTAKVQP
jgi:hypothetical protein